MSTKNKEIYTAYVESVAGIHDTAQTDDSYQYAPKAYREDEEQHVAPPVDNKILHIVVHLAQDAMNQKGESRTEAIAKLKKLVSSLQ